MERRCNGSRLRQLQRHRTWRRPHDRHNRAGRHGKCQHTKQRPHCRPQLNSETRDETVGFHPSTCSTMRRADTRVSPRLWSELEWKTICKGRCFGSRPLPSATQTTKRGRHECEVANTVHWSYSASEQLTQGHGICVFDLRRTAWC